METSKRRSRFVDFAPSGKTFRVTAYDLDLLDLLQDYRYLPSTFIIALAGGNPIYLRQRLTALRKDFGLVKCPSPSWAAANALQRPAVYQLTDKGELLLKAQGRWRDLKKTGEPFKDQLTVCMARASIAIGLKAYPQLSLSSPGDILKHAPEQTRNLQSPFIIPVEFTYRSNTTETFLKTTVRHDCLPFGIQNADTTRWLLSPGMEIDCDTEGLTSTNAHRASIDKHLLEILELLKGGYKKHYGFPKCVVPFVVIGEGRMRAIMRRLEVITGGAGHDRIIFKHIPDFTSFNTFPKGDDAFLSTPWERVGFPPFEMLKELQVVQ